MGVERAARSRPNQRLHPTRQRTHADASNRPQSLDWSDRIVAWALPQLGDGFGYSTTPGRPEAPCAAIPDPDYFRVRLYRPQMTHGMSPVKATRRGTTRCRWR